MNTVISSKGQVVIPAELRQIDAIYAGQRFDIERVHAGEYVLRRRVEPGNGGLLAWLQACPEKDWFKSLESESTDTL